MSIRSNNQKKNMKVWYRWISKIVVVYFKERNYVIQTNFSLPFDSAHHRRTLNERSKCQHPPKKKLLKNRLCGVIICRIRVNNYIWMGNWMWMVFDHCNDTKTQLKQFSFSIGLNRLPRFVIHANDECFGNSEYCRHNLNGICKPCLIPFSKLDRSQDKLKQWATIKIINNVPYGAVKCQDEVCVTHYLTINSTRADIKTITNVVSTT